MTFCCKQLYPLFPTPSHFSPDMNSIVRKAGFVLAGAAALAACRKDDPKSLEGPIPTPTFTVSLNTTQFPVTATFTSTTTDAFLYQWDFGDGSPLASGTTVTHTYTSADTYRVKLTAAGKGGQGVSPQQAVEVPGVCGNAAYAVLTACAGNGATSWTLSDQPGAVQIIGADGTVQSSLDSLNACQLDDQFSFTSSFSYSYASNGSTFSNGTCGIDQSGNASFVYRPNGDFGDIVLQSKGAFIGTADSVVNKTYTIVSATPNKLVLSGTLPNGSKVVTTYQPQLSSLDRAKRFLTGGSSRTWVLDNTVAATITVGTEDNPTRDFAGGVLGSLPDCQADDEYTFTDDNKFIYNANGQTFVAGDYACEAPRDVATTYAFAPAVGTGLAQFTLSASTAFIGATDASAGRIYRILSIDDTHMLLRGGLPTEEVFTIKLRVK